MSPFEIRLRAIMVKWRGFARTYQLATHLDMKTADVRRVMLRLERQGIVRRSRHSAVNDISWEMSDGQGQADPPSSATPVEGDKSRDGES